jgi:hypothetical protein
MSLTDELPDPTKVRRGMEKNPPAAALAITSGVVFGVVVAGGLMRKALPVEEVETPVQGVGATVSTLVAGVVATALTFKGLGEMLKKPSDLDLFVKLNVGLAALAGVMWLIRRGDDR